MDSEVDLLPDGILADLSSMSLKSLSNVEGESISLEAEDEDEQEGEIVKWVVEGGEEEDEDDDDVCSD